VISIFIETYIQKGIKCEEEKSLVGIFLSTKQKDFAMFPVSNKKSPRGFHREG